MLATIKLAQLPRTCLALLVEHYIKFRYLNENFDASANNLNRMKKEFNVIVNGTDEVIGGRNNEEGQMFQPIKHLSGK